MILKYYGYCVDLWSLRSLVVFTELEVRGEAKKS